MPSPEEIEAAARAIAEHNGHEYIKKDFDLSVINAALAAAEQVRDETKAPDETDDERVERWLRLLTGDEARQERIKDGQIEPGNTAEVHTCSEACPCQHGGEPTPDFLGVRPALDDVMEAGRRVVEARKQPCEGCHDYCYDCDPNTRPPREQPETGPRLTAAERARAKTIQKRADREAEITRLSKLVEQLRFNYRSLKEAHGITDDADEPLPPETGPAPTPSPDRVGNIGFSQSLQPGSDDVTVTLTWWEARYLLDLIAVYNKQPIDEAASAVAKLEAATEKEER